MELIHQIVQVNYISVSGNNVIIDPIEFIYSVLLSENILLHSYEINASNYAILIPFRGEDCEPMV